MQILRVILLISVLSVCGFAQEKNLKVSDEQVLKIENFDLKQQLVQQKFQALYQKFVQTKEAQDLVKEAETLDKEYSDFVKAIFAAKNVSTDDYKLNVKEKTLELNKEKLDGKKPG